MDERLPRWIRIDVPALLLCVWIGSGCSVLEVIDNMGGDTPSPAAEASSDAQPGAAADSGTAQAKLKAYYNRRPRRAAKEDPDNPIIRCELNSGTSFLRKHDCELRGGRELG